MRDLKEKRLDLLPGMTVPSELTFLVAGPINVRIIGDHWVELQRLAMSIKTGTVTASVILRKLAAYPRQNGLASRYANWASWNGRSLRSNGCRTPSCVAGAMSVSTRVSSKMRFVARYSRPARRNP